MDIVLQEWKKQEFSRAELDPYAEEIHREYSLYVDVIHPTFSTEWVLQAKGYVGYLPFSGGVIEIQPKVSVANLFGMLDVAYGLKSFHILKGLTDTSSLADFYSRLASILARRVLTRSRKGLYRTYRSESSSLSFIRGRIDVRESLRSPLDPALVCRYEDHTTDVEENQLILWTLSTILRSGLCSGEYLPPVRHAYRILSRFTSLQHFSHTDCMGRLYNRLNDDYEPMHGLCRFFLERTGPSQGVSNRRMLPFVISMHQLFEEFVAKWLAARINSSDRYVLRTQKSLDAGSFNIYPDLVIENRETGEPMLVADTKYKIGLKVAPEDVNQVLAYSIKLGCSEAVLIYPFVTENPYSHDWNGTNVRCMEFNLDRSIEEGGEVLLIELLNLCMQANEKRVQETVIL
ncbi:MAG: restriction endonuclease [Candidatus Sabulitectum sp.]|nr:restriction endonuclease [Candidatus Sabulitectum sp.]